VVTAQYFDGSSARGQAVQLRIEGDELVAELRGAAPAAAPLRWPLASVSWPERTRHGQRVVQLRGGGSLLASDSAAFDAWRRQSGAAEGWVVRVQQNWRATGAAVLALLLVLAGGYRWGVPLAGRALVQAVPQEVDRAVGEAAWQQIEPQWLKPTALSAARQEALRTAFAQAVRAGYPAGPAPAYELRFAAAAKAVGPNAFALPGGTLIVTDALVELLHDHDDTLVGVLAHELGHLRHRHGMRSLVQFALVGTVAALALGDFSTLLAGVPALLAQLAYSRDAEREADAEAARVLRAAGLSPAVMVVLFERLPAARREAQGAGLEAPVAFASHPMDEERMRFFRQAATGGP
jgi:Zn-dependent protease with chaperone function